MSDPSKWTVPAGQFDRIADELERPARIVEPLVELAQRTDWHATNHEATHTLDARYGTAHRPAYARTGAGWTSACGCPNPSCDRAYDDCLYPTWHDALDAARTNLTLAEHGE